MNKNKKYLIYFFTISALLSLATLSCRGGSSVSTEPNGETRLLKISVKETIDSRADLSIQVGESVFEKGELAKGVHIPINRIVPITVVTSIPDAAVFWTGRRVLEEERRKKEFSVLMDEDIYLVLTVAENSTPIEIKKLSVFIGDSGKLLIDDEEYKGYNVITLAEGQNVGLLAKPDANYYFGGWYGDATFSYNKELSLTMVADKDISVSFVDDISVGLVISPIENGTVKINGAVYDKSREYRFQIGENVTLDAVADSGYKFLGWSGSVASSEEKLQFIVDTDMAISPVFGEPNGVAILTINPTAGGKNKVKYKVKRGAEYITTSEITLEKQHNILYSDGSSAPLQKDDIIEFEALPGEGYLKVDAGVKWTGGASGEGLKKKFVMLEESKAIAANFALENTKLTVKVIRQYIDKNGVTKTEIDSTSDSTYVPKSSNPLASENWGFSVKIGSTTIPTTYNSAAFSRVFDKDNYPEPKYGDAIILTAINGDHYRLKEIKIGATTQTTSTANFNITSDTTVEIYLTRNQFSIPLQIVNGYYYNTTTGTKLQTYVRVAGGGLEDKDYLSTGITTPDYSINVLSGQNITFTPNNTAAYSFANFSGGASGTGATTINNIKAAPAKIVSTFNINNVTLTLKNARYWNNGTADISITPDTVADISGFSIQDGAYSFGANLTADTTRTYDYGTKLNIIGNINNATHYDKIEITGGDVYIEGNKTATAKVYHKVNKFNLTVSRIGSGNPTVTIAKSGISDGDYTVAGSKVINVLASRNAELTANSGNDTIFKGYASGLTGKRLTVYKPSLSVNLDAKFVSATPWNGSDETAVTGSPLKIYTPAQLAWLGKQPPTYLKNKTVHIMNDINMGNNSQFRGINTGGNPNDSKYKIENFILDGQGYEIANLNIDGGTGSWYALVGVISTGSVIKNISTSGMVKATGTVAGIVAAVFDTTINNCYNNADVLATSTGYSRPGGVSSYVFRSTLSKSYNSGNITTPGNEAGGVVALLHTGTITESYNTGYVEAGTRAGGVLGRSESWGGLLGIISNVYNYGNVKAISEAGGIVGYGDNNTTRILYSYNIGSVSATSEAGAILGNRNSNPIFTATYYVNTLGITALGYSTDIASTTSLSPPTSGATFAQSLIDSDVSVWKAFDSPFNIVNGVDKRPVLIGVGEGK